jgi:hypothetical protein
MLAAGTRSSTLARAVSCLPCCHNSAIAHHTAPIQRHADQPAIRHSFDLTWYSLLFTSFSLYASIWRHCVPMGNSSLFSD